MKVDNGEGEYACILLPCWKNSVMKGESIFDWLFKVARFEFHYHFLRCFAGLSQCSVPLVRYRPFVVVEFPPSVVYWIYLQRSVWLHDYGIHR